MTFGQEGDIAGEHSSDYTDGVPRYLHDFDGGCKPGPMLDSFRDEARQPAYPTDLAQHRFERALDRQVGGDHYCKLSIQPGEYAMANRLNYWQSLALRYMTRYKDKNGRQDLEKAIDCLQKLIAAEYPE